MFRHTCFNEVAMSPLFYISTCAFCPSTFMGAILPAQATSYLLVWAMYLLFRDANLLFLLCLIWNTYYNYIWDFRASCVSERATVFRNDSLRCSYSLKHRSCDTAYLLNKMMDPPDDPRGLCDPT